MTTAERDGHMTVNFNDGEIAELYRMVQWWCREHSNTFHYIKEAIERRYPKITETNGADFDW